MEFDKSLECEEDPEDQDESNNYTESDSEDSDSDDCMLVENKPTQDYVKEVTSLLYKHVNVSHENALALNRAMQSKLCHIREILEDLLHKCELKYKKNEDILLNPKENTPQLPNYRLCGAPFFKDLSGFSAPVNEDYRKRSTSGELFFMDLQLNYIRYWTVNDKRNLIKAVKEQLLDHLNPKNKSEKNAAYRDTTRNIDLNTKRLATLLLNAKNFEIDWELISNIGLNGRHSQKACYAMWHGYMKPELNRGTWTDEENQRLMSTAEKYNFQNWSAIGSEMKNRSESQCFVQFQNTVNKHLPANRKWTPYEDRQLLKAVEKHSTDRIIKWNNISGYFINRSKKAIHSRYHNVLSTDLKKGPFSREEDCILLAAIEEYGENFACIPMSLFPNRSRVQVKNRYLNTIKYQQMKRGWTAEDDETLVNYVKEHGKGKWSEISKILKVHPRGSCRTRYNVIEKFFKKNPKATLKDVPRKNRKILTDICKDNWAEKMYELKVIGDVKAQELEKRKEKFKKMLSNRADTYRGMLRTIDRILYDMLKYSYDYYFMKPTIIPSFIKLTLPFYLDTLTCTFSPEMLSQRCKSFTKEEFQSLNDLLKKSQGKTSNMNAVTQIPVNWSTILGMRALTILANNDNFKNIIQKTKVQPPKYIEAENKFKERFKKIFFKTALLTRLNPDALVESKFIVRYTVEKDNRLSNVSATTDSIKRAIPCSTSETHVKRQKI